MHSFHKTHSNIEDAAVSSLRAGVNLECGSAFQYLSNAYYSGKIFNSDLDSALFPLLRLKFELGILDEPGSHAFDTLSAYHIHHPSHRLLALEAAEKSLVLLENKKNTLPLSLTTSSIALVGPLVFEPFVLLGNYHGWSPEMNTVLEGVLQAAPSTVNIEYEQAFSLYSTPTERTFDYKKLSSHEALIVTLGINSLFQGEAGDAFLSDAGGDLGKLALPSNQVQFLRELRSNYSGKLIVLLFSGGPLITAAIEPYCDALLWCGYPGEQGGSAIGRALFGRFSPSGKLPITFPEREEHLPAFDNYSLVNRTYRYTNFTPEYSFGYGLSYLDVHMSELTSTWRKDQNSQPSQLSIVLSNTSKNEGEEVLQFYLHPISSTENEANYTLIHFERVYMKGNDKKTLSINLPSQAWLTTNTEGQQVPLTGNYELIASTKGPFNKEAIRLLFTL
jgi:beta-glucosidase